MPKGRRERENAMVDDNVVLVVVVVVEKTDPRERNDQSC